MREMTLTALPGIPEVTVGADLAALVLEGLGRAGRSLQNGDVLVIAQKIVSKSEGRTVRLADVTPSARAQELAQRADRDPRFVELILRESRAVLRVKPGVLIVEHSLGFVMASAGIDQSNVPGEDGSVLLLPEDPDASARRLREDLVQKTAADVGIVINDSFGRAWRNGVAGVAIGVAGIPALVDLRGRADRGGRALKVTQVAAADEIASAASLLMGQAEEGLPVVLARGFPYARRASAASELVRPRAEDLFR
ncbi:MAG TPA: coenzyme F420-0:L-glutamate ligase [Burkholderiales bacterium]|jgi:coenzyme F420-0:L-glutamate ligase/coenzyme F420-1:gamma-L-glutamate ligase|nr:coenzyme F420-0:L-glutamate ligase [Burkholderiales bacterium]